MISTLQKYIYLLFICLNFNLRSKVISESIHRLQRASSNNSISFSFSDRITENTQQELHPPIVTISSGTLEGYYMTILGRKKIYAFEGIPYSEPPIGENRFKPAQPKIPWIGVRQAHDIGPECLQWDDMNPTTIGVEDCLTVNVYTPDIPYENSTNKNLSVLVFIHGGGYTSGSANLYGPAYLLKEDLILVTFNYRLGIFGSMNTGDKVAPGNYGLKDQAMAINWVHAEIANFGGDAKKITICGQSAGSSSVHLQMMSPLARDKIASAISFSGGAYHFWGFQTMKEGKIHAFLIAAISFCPLTRGSQAVIDCMRKIPAHVLLIKQNIANTWIYRYGSAVFTLPYNEPDLPGAFLTVTPDEAYATGQVANVPYITTIARNDVNFFFAIPQYFGVGPNFEQLLTNLLPGLVFGIRGKVPRKKEFQIMRKIRKKFGTRGGNIPLDQMKIAANERAFLVPFHKVVQMHSQIAPTYAGLFNYTSNIGLADQLGLKPQDFGPLHADEIRLIFNTSFTRRIRKGRDDSSFKYTQFFTNVLKNFAETGIPTLKIGEEEHNFWEATKDSENVKLFEICDTPKMIDDPFKKVSKFWESLGIPQMTPYFKFLF